MEAQYCVFTIKATKMVGERGIVVAIGSDPHHVEYLKKNVKLNGLENVIIIKKAARSSKDVLQLRDIWEYSKCICLEVNII